jgi:hypothetical protein
MATQRATDLPRCRFSEVQATRSIARMGSSASLDRSELTVEPGQEVSAQLRVRNNGSVVDQFTFAAVGDGAAWIDTEPATLSLFPGAEGAVTVNFRPPRSPNVRPGPTPFGVKVISTEDPDGSAVEEGVITVGTFADRSVELYPLTARGRRRARFELAVDNRGNAPITIQLAGSDPENACTYEFARQTVLVEPGTAHFTKLTVVPRRTFWKGPPKTHQFQVLVTEVVKQPELVTAVAGGLPPPTTVPPPPTLEVEPEAVVSPPPETVNGTMLQEALIPPWLVKAILAILALALVLWILWLTLFKPTVESAARDAVAAPLTSLEEQVNAIASTTVPGGGGGAPTTVGGGGGGGGDVTTTTTAGGGGGTGGDVTTTTPVTFLTPFGNPSDFQLGIGSSVPAGSAQSFDQSFSTQFAVTDIVLQNPAGDTGLVQISRNGAVLMSSALENFRDLDLHFVAPFMFQNGQTLTMTVTCTTPGPNAPGCSTSASFGGFAK